MITSLIFTELEFQAVANQFCKVRNSLPIDLVGSNEGSAVIRVATCNQEGGLAVGPLHVHMSTATPSNGGGNDTPRKGSSSEPIFNYVVCEELVALHQ